MLQPRDSCFLSAASSRTLPLPLERSLVTGQLLEVQLPFMGRNVLRGSFRRAKGRPGTWAQVHLTTTDLSL